MRGGVAVIAAAPGTVLGTRDGVPDQRQGSPGAPDIEGRECGNGVLIERPDGWRFQYCHLRRGSVRVRKGDTVAAGEFLGEVGLSGKTQFPHLHLTVRDAEGRVLDPFDARQQEEACGLPGSASLWRDLGPDAYQPGGALTAGFLDRLPDYSEIKRGTANAGNLPRDADALVFWAFFFGLRDSDRLLLRLSGPDDQTLAENTHTMSKNRALQYKAVGQRLTGTGWPAGVYRGTAQMIRDGVEIDRIERQIRLD